MKNTTAQDLINDMENGKSVLLSFGESGKRLRREIAATGLICRILLFMIFNPFFRLRVRLAKNKEKLYKRRKSFAVWLAKIVFKFKTKGHTKTDFSEIFVINHPTLNDPLCALFYALTCYPNREIILPVNLPWFESISKYRQKLLAVKINIVPIITPKTVERLSDSPQISSVQQNFITHYLSSLTEILSNGGMSVVAQQATRQRFLFANKEQYTTGENILSTISLIIACLKRAKILEKIIFVPTGVVPHSTKARQSLNLFRCYTLNFNKSISAIDLIEVSKELSAKRAPDLKMLHMLAEVVPEFYYYENIS